MLYWSYFQKKIQAREKEVYGRKAKEKEIEKEIEKRQENKIKNTDENVSIYLQ